MKQSLYNIVEEQRYTLSEIENMGGELTPELRRTINNQCPPIRKQIHCLFGSNKRP